MLKDRDLQVIIGKILRIGVWSAMLTVIVGFLLLLLQSKGGQIDYAQFRADQFFRLNVFLKELGQGDPLAIIQLGLMILIATPVARVVFTMVGFALEKDRLYAFISFLVLCIIVFSMVYEIG